MGKWTRQSFLKRTLMLGAAALMAACAPAGGQEDKGSEADPIEALARGQGAVLALADQEVAVYKDDAGGVVRLSPVCPHQGCTIGWNGAEDTWDCPCHASRFEPDGTYITGPANEDLESIG
ncbi:MAG: Rieske 2Fe-2S domain-containing protein [Anaerolineales bacterium]